MFTCLHTGSYNAYLLLLHDIVCTVVVRNPINDQCCLYRIAEVVYYFLLPNVRNIIIVVSHSQSFPVIVSTSAVSPLLVFSVISSHYLYSKCQSNADVTCQYWSLGLLVETNIAVITSYYQSVMLLSVIAIH